MRLPLRPFALLAVAAIATACNRGDAPKGADSAAPATAASTNAQTGEQMVADVTSYRLTMEKVDQYLAAQRNLGLRMKDMSPEEREAIKARNDANADKEGDESLEDMARKIDAEPALAAAVHDAGLSSREYAVITMSLLQSGMAASVLKMRPKDNQDSLVREMKANPDNVRFMVEHEAELQQKQQALQAEMKRLGVATDG